MPRLVEAIQMRISSGGLVESKPEGHLTVKVFASRDDATLAWIKRSVGVPGVLEFRITADPNRADIRNIIEQAQSTPPTETAVKTDGKEVARWVTYSAEEFGPPNVADFRTVKRMAGDVPQALVLIDSWNVAGDDLKSVFVSLDNGNLPAVHFTFNNRGAAYFGQLTSDNLPDRAANSYRYLGIILDDRLLQRSAYQFADQRQRNNQWRRHDTRRRRIHREYSAIGPVAQQFAVGKGTGIEYSGP